MAFEGVCVGNAIIIKKLRIDRALRDDDDDDEHEIAHCIYSHIICGFFSGSFIVIFALVTATTRSLALFGGKHS